MKGLFKANYISQRDFLSKDGQKKYFFAKFNDGDSDLELQTEGPLALDRFAEVQLIVDVVQGKYPRFNLVELKVVK